MGIIVDIRCNKQGLKVGAFERKLLIEDSSESCSCNEPYKDKYWCPELKWFMNNPCPFVSRQDCTNWENQCYGKTY